MIMANKKLKQAMADKDKENIDNIDQELTVRMGSIIFEYRKEYIEFFMSFFKSDQEIQDELKLKALEEYEKMKKQIDIKVTIEKVNKIESIMQVNVFLDNSRLQMPIYNTIEEKFMNEEITQVQNQLIDINDKSAWILETGQIKMNNLKKKDCPDGKMPLYLSFSPKLIFVETFSKWLAHDLSDTV